MGARCATSFLTLSERKPFPRRLLLLLVVKEANLQVTMMIQRQSSRIRKLAKLLGVAQLLGGHANRGKRVE